MDRGIPTCLFSPAIGAGDFVFLSGMAAIDPATWKIGSLTNTMV